MYDICIDGRARNDTCNRGTSHGEINGTIFIYVYASLENSIYVSYGTIDIDIYIYIGIMENNSIYICERHNYEESYMYIYAYLCYRNSVYM